MEKNNKQMTPGDFWSYSWYTDNKNEKLRGIKSKII